MPWVSPWLCYGCECFTSQIFHDFDSWAWVSILPTGGCACANCIGLPLQQLLAAPFMYAMFKHKFRVRKGWPCALRGGTQVQTEHGFVLKSMTPQCHDDVVLWVHAAHMIYTWTYKESPICPSQEETRRQLLWHPSLRRRKSAQKDQTRYCRIYIRTFFFWPREAHSDCQCLKYFSIICPSSSCPYAQHHLVPSPSSLWVCMTITILE